jgi:hypothetical protein
MTKKKSISFSGIQYGKLKINRKTIISIMVIIILGIILSINIGYNKRDGCYWKPADVKIEIKKEKE